MTKVTQQCVTKIISVSVMNLVMPIAGAKGKLLFNKSASDAGLLNKSLCFASALVVMKIITIIVIN